MKRLVLIGLMAISLISCKKKTTTEPTKTTTPPVATVSDKTVTILCSTNCGGTLKMVWDYDYNLPPMDTSYYYSTSTSYTRILKSDSIRMYFYSSTCSVCAPCASSFTLTVNGNVKKTISNDMGYGYYYIGL